MQIIFLQIRTIGLKTYQVNDIADIPKANANYLIRIGVAEDYTMTSLAASLAAKVDKVTGKSLVSDTLITKLQNAPNITVSALPPDNPSTNDLWFPIQ